MKNTLILFCLLISSIGCKETPKTHSGPIVEDTIVEDAIVEDPIVEEVEAESEMKVDQEASNLFNYKAEASSEILNLISKYENLESKKWDPSKILNFNESDRSDVTAYVSSTSSPARILVKQLDSESNKSMEFCFDKDQNLFLVIEKEFSNGNPDPTLENHVYINKYKILKKVVDNKYENSFSAKEITEEEQRIKAACTKYIDLSVVKILESLR